MEGKLQWLSEPLPIMMSRRQSFNPSGVEPGVPSWLQAAAVWFRADA